MTKRSVGAHARDSRACATPGVVPLHLCQQHCGVNVRAKTPRCETPVSRSVSPSFCLVFLLCLVCLLCLPNLPVSICQSVWCVVRVNTTLLVTMNPFSSPPSTPHLSSPRPPHTPVKELQAPWMTMRRDNNQRRLQEPSEDHRSGRASLARRTQPWTFWSQSTLLEVPSTKPKSSPGTTFPYFLRM